MSFLDISTEVTARDEVARMFDAERARYGYVPNFAQVFALRPGVYVAWAQLNVAIKAGMDHRRYELATLAAADVAIMDFADKLTGDASAITAADIDKLREHGLSDEDIFQVALAVAAR